MFYVSLFAIETTSSQTRVVAGSVVGALVLVTIVLILGIVVHRRYTCIFTFNIGNIYIFFLSQIKMFREQFYLPDLSKLIFSNSQ